MRNLSITNVREGRKNSGQLRLSLGSWSRELEFFVALAAAPSCKQGGESLLHRQSEVVPVSTCVGGDQCVVAQHNGRALGEI